MMASAGKTRSGSGTAVRPQSRFANPRLRQTTPELLVGENEIDQKVLQNARKSGQLSVVNRGLTKVPDSVWRINRDLPPESQELVLAGGDMPDKTRWWEQEPLSKLVLASNKITEISDDVELLVDLNVLDLTDNKIATLPDGLGRCLKLERVLLSHNKLTELPSCIFKLHDLRVLKVDHNLIRALPDDITNLFYLEELDASHNVISQLPASFNGLRVHRLLLSHNQITNVPSEIGWLQSLRILDLSDNRLSQIPAEIGELEKLELLYLQRNQISALPLFDKSYSLKEIYLGCNRISEIPNGFFARVLSLKILDISENKLSELPIDIKELTALERLNIEKNEIRNIAPEIGLMNSLKALKLDGNPIRTIRRDLLSRPTSELLQLLRSRLDDNEKENSDAVISPRKSDVSRTKCLDYSNRKLVHLPPDACDLCTSTEISTIDVSRNLLTAFPEELVEPCSINTRVFNIGLNRLETLSASIGRFQYLSTLDVRCNALVSLPDELANCKAMRELIVSGNRFIELPPVVYKLTNLEILMAQENKIARIDAVQLAKLSMLTVLNLMNNDLTVVPPELGNLVTLRSLQLDGNSFKVPSHAVLGKGTAEILKYLRNRIVS